MGSERAQIIARVHDQDTTSFKAFLMNMLLKCPAFIDPGYTLKIFERFLDDFTKQGILEVKNLETSNLPCNH